jgi:peptidoglycan/xylan/chitin deacetylase (PgdA/CDA1 family)
VKNQLIKTIARELIFPITVNLGLHRLLISQSNGVLNIYFHGITPKDYTDVSGRHMQLHQFEKLLSYLKSNFQIIDMKTSFNMQKPTYAKEKFISISFDDGYLNNYKYLPEITLKHKIPVTIFACGVAFEQKDYVMWTDQIALMRYFMKNDYIEISNEKYFKSGPYNLKSNDGVSLYDLIKKMGPNNRQIFLNELDEKYKTIEQAKNFDEDYWKLMDANQIKELHNTGFFDIASHGMYHYNLSNIKEEEAKKDMFDAAALLKKITNSSIDAISFPDGSYNAQVIHQALAVEHKKLWISDYNNASDIENPYLRTRFGVSSTTNHYSNIISIHQAFKKYGI